MKNGGRTPIAGMVHSVVLLLILIVLMPYAALIPMPAIAAIPFYGCLQYVWLERVCDSFENSAEKRYICAGDNICADSCV